MSLKNSNLLISNSTFVSNKAFQDGGVILLSCKDASNPCSYVIKDSKFINNTAMKDGGVIKYDSYPLEISSNNLFSGNKA